VHIRKILAAVNAEKIKKKKFKIVVDPVNGAGCKLSPKLLKRLGCKVSLLHANPDKTFERPAEPTPKAISALAKKVKAVGADAGFALDPDADRLAIVDEQGHALSEELSVVLATDYLLKSKPPRQYVVANLSTTMALDDIVKKHRGRLVRTKIGEVHVSEKMKQLKAAIGGEGNGGVIFPKVGFNRDSFSGMTLILVYLASSGEKLSTLVNKIPPYHHIKEKITVSSAREAAALIKKTKAVFKGEKVDLTEGIKIIFKDGWLHVRASNTEPIVRVMGEGKDKRKIIDCCHKILGAQT
jgi:phosphomannomutase